MKHLIVCQERFAVIDANEFHNPTDYINKLKEAVKELQEIIHELREQLEESEDVE